MKYSLHYQRNVVENDIPALDQAMKTRIKAAINGKLLIRPEVFGKPLRKSLRGFRKLRVGDYRVIFLIQGERIEIFAIGHRSKAYKKIRSFIS